MSNDSGGGEKTEKPTPKKIQDAREEGQVAQSKELTTACAVIAIVFYFMFSSRVILRDISASYSNVWEQIRTNNLEAATIFLSIKENFIIGIQVFLIPIAIGAATSFFANVVQINGIVLSKKFPKFELNSFNPVSNAKNIFSLKSFIKFVRQAIEVTIMTLTAFYLLQVAMPNIVKLYYLSLPDQVFLMGKIISKLFVAILIIHLCFSIFDFVIEKWNLNKQLMMSMHDLKEEQKNTDGNPEVKAKRRELFQELLEDDFFGNDISDMFILANPTHIAIVVAYNPQTIKLPAILFKEKGAKALEVFRLAKKLGIPIIRDKWLARQLYAFGEVGKYIPASLLKHIADIIGKNLHIMPNIARHLIKPGDKRVVSRPGLF